MNSREFIANALKTESNDFTEIAKRLSDPSRIRLLHAALGMQTEVAEFADALKKHLFYGKPLDMTNLTEEIGDTFWYLAIACDELGMDFEVIWELIIAKLKSRYGDKFNEDGAVNRNLDVERSILEGTSDADLILNWTAAETHFNYVKSQYENLVGMPAVNTTLALNRVFKPLAERYANGERSRELYDAMMGVE